GSRRGSRGPPKVDRPHANRTSDYDMPLRVEGRPAPGTGGRSSPILGPSINRRRVPRNAEGRNKELEFTRSQPLAPHVHRTPHFSNQTQIAAAVNRHTLRITGGIGVKPQERLSPQISAAGSISSQKDASGGQARRSAPKVHRPGQN